MGELQIIYKNGRHFLVEIDEWYNDDTQAYEYTENEICVGTYEYCNEAMEEILRDQAIACMF